MTALNINALTANTPSTSDSYTFSVNHYDIIRASALDIGAIDPYDVLTTLEYSDCSRKLNMLVKQWMGNTDFAPGLKVWTRRRADLFLGNTQYSYKLGESGDNWVASTTGVSFPQLYGQTTLVANASLGQTVLQVASIAQMNINDYIGILIGADIYWTRITALNGVPVIPTVTISTPGLPAAALAGGASYVWNYTKKAVRPLSLVAAVLRDIYMNDIPLDFLTVERYESLPNKAAPTNQGDPTSILYESQFRNQSPNGRLYIDVGGAQDVTKIIHCTFLAPTQDLVNPGDAPDYPQQWYRALVLGCGREICGMFDCSWSSENEANLQEALAIARQADPQTSDAYFEVNGGSSPYSP